MFPPPFQDISPVLVVVYLVGLLISLVAGIWLLIVGFKEHVLWGLAMLCGGGCGQFAFLIVHFGKAWKPMLIQLTGVALMVVSAGVIGTKLQAAAQMEAQAAEQKAQRAAKEAAERAANPPVVDQVEPPLDIVPAPVEPPATKPPVTVAEVPAKSISLTGSKRSAYKQLGQSKA